MKRFELDQYKNEIIKLYVEEKLTCETIALKVNASLCGVYDALRRWGVKTRNLSDSHRDKTLMKPFLILLIQKKKLIG